MAASLPSLSVLLAAVRAHAPLAGFVADESDAHLSDLIRTARTVKGAIWLVTRAAGPQEDAAKQVGQADTAVRCLRKLAEFGDPRALAALAAWEAADLAASEALAADLSAELLAA